MLPLACKLCGAPMASLNIAKGGYLEFCSRRGCKGHALGRRRRHRRDDEPDEQDVRDALRLARRRRRRARRHRSAIDRGSDDMEAHASSTSRTSTTRARRGPDPAPAEGPGRGRLHLPRADRRDPPAERECPLSQIYGVATFYAQFRLHPVGKQHHPRLPRHGLPRERRQRDHRGAGGPAAGSATGETTPDRLFTLETVSCLGCCSLAPVIMVNNDTHGNLKPDRPQEGRSSSTARPTTEAVQS